MGRKYEVTGQAVIYTADGAKIIDAEVRRTYNINLDECTFRFDKKTQKALGEKYLMIGGARTVPTENLYARSAYCPERIENAWKYTQTKFFRLMIDLMRLAQWEPIHRQNCFMNANWFYTNNFHAGQKPDIAFGVSVEEIDEQLYRKYGFTLEMIEFAEARYK